MKLRIDFKDVISFIYGFAPYLIVVVFFGIVYASSLTFLYVEGDDATSVAFHALGRNVKLQPPYSPYHGMMDIFLGVLPASETVVRHSAIVMSALGAIVMIALIIRLISDWLPDIENWKLCIVGPTILLCIPEVFYLSIGYFPSIIAMSFVLAAHVLIRIASWRYYAFSVATRSFISIFILSSILFGAGVACRWDIGVYLIFIAADLTFNAKEHGQLTRGIRFSLIWGLTAFSAAMGAIFYSGYGIGEIQSTLNLARTEILSRDSWFATIGAYQTLFTPAFMIFFLAGLTCLARKRKSLFLVLLVGIMSVTPYLFSREPKMLLPAFPAICLSIAVGVNLIWFAKTKARFLILTKVALVIFLLSTWFVGIQFSSNDTSWGPGFEVRTIAADSSDGKIANRIKDQVADRTVSITNFDLIFAGGFAIPTPDGPRPLGGHAFILINGGWRDFMVKLDEERRKTIELAITSQLNILQDEGNSYLTTKLLEMDSFTTDARSRFVAVGISERRFIDKQGNQVNIQILKSSRSLFEERQIEELIKLNSGKRVILYSGYSSNLKRMAHMSPDSIIPLGPFSAIVDLGAYYRAIRNQSNPN